MSGAPVVRLGIRVRRERAEEALAALLPLLSRGAEESEPTAGTVEYALYDSTGELPSAAAVRALVGSDLIGLRVSTVPAGWERRWHAHLRPVEVGAGGRRLRILPATEPVAPAAARRLAAAALDRAADPDDRRDAGPAVAALDRVADRNERRAAEPAAPLDLVIDPRDSFGLGGHPSTRLCLQLLLELEPGGALCDWGAGSGVLALAAARLGWAPVTAVEIDPGALAAIEANAVANGIDLHVLALDLGAAAPPWADTVCANLPADVHATVAVERPPVRLIAAGMLAGQADDVAAAYACHRLRETRRRVLDGWAGLLLERA
jgi:ribosomal protein L11 methyltransferase